MLRTLRQTCQVLIVLALLASLGACATSGGGSAAGKSGRGASEVTDWSGEGLEAEVARLRAERDRLAHTNVVLVDELRWAHDDLQLVELQFSEFEHRLTEDLGKAAAVTAAAEARIHLDQARKTIATPDSTFRRVSLLLATSEKLIRANNYPAALFFAERANHTLQSAERRASLNVGVTTKIVAVSGANVREGPGQQYPVRVTLREGDSVSCLDVARSWCHVVTASGSSGWIHVTLLR